MSSPSLPCLLHPRLALPLTSRSLSVSSTSALPARKYENAGTHAQQGQTAILLQALFLYQVECFDLSKVLLVMHVKPGTNVATDCKVVD